MTDTPQLNRRNVLKTIAGAGAAGALGAGALLASGPAAAQSFTINDTTLSNNDGQVSWVAVNVGGTLAWDGFDTPVDRLRFVSEVNMEGQSPVTLADVTSDPLPDWSSDGDGSDGWGGPGEYVVSSADDYREGEVHTDAQWVVIGDGTDPSGYRTSGLNVPDWTDQLSVDADGESQTTTVEKTSTTYFLDANGNEVGVGSVSDTATFDVTVTNEQSTTSGSSSGDSTAE